MGELPADEIFEEEEESGGDTAAQAEQPRREVTAFTVKRQATGARLDVHLAGRYGRLSRSCVQRLIKTGAVLVNGARVKPSYKLVRGDQVSVALPPPPVRELAPEYAPLDILHEDELMLAVNKPPGIVVHPARGHWGGTLINAVLYHCHKLSNIAPGRPGIVHRLDRDTTGVILFMKDDWAHRHVARQFEYRRVEKEYLAVVEGKMKYDSGEISFPLGRHPTNTRKMAVRMADGRAAHTSYKVLERFGAYTFIRAMPKTGRTHQIRVHLAAMGHPVAGDELYSKKGPVFPCDLEGHSGDHPSDEEPIMSRQALHAYRLNIEYPGSGERMEFKAPLPGDMERFLEALRRAEGG